MAWIRCCGGSAKKEKVIDDLNTLGFSTPSSTSSGNVNRTFTKNSIVRGLAGNNFYNTSGISVTTRTANTITYVATGGYGIGLVTRLNPNDTFTAKIVRNSGVNFYQFYVCYYAANGQFLTSTQTLSLNTLYSLTVPSNAEYTVIVIDGEGTIEATVDLVRM